MTGPGTSHRQVGSYVRRNFVSAQRESPFPRFPSVVPLELLQLLGACVVKGKTSDIVPIITLLFSSYYPTLLS